MQKKYFFFLGFMALRLFHIDLSQAAGPTENLTIGPIIGFERVQKLLPTPHMKTRGIIGARALYRLPISSLEAEYTHAEDTSADLTNDISYKDVEDKLRLGLRGQADLAGFMSLHLRGGAQARSNKHTKTVSTGVTTSETKAKVQPYIGSGLELHILQYFSVSADILATYTPTNDPNLNDYELQPSLGLIFKF